MNKKEIQSVKAARDAMEMEWKNLVDKDVWGATRLREWSDVAAIAKEKKASTAPRRQQPEKQIEQATDPDKALRKRKEEHKDRPRAAAHRARKRGH